MSRFYRSLFKRKTKKIVFELWNNHINWILIYQISKWVRRSNNSFCKSKEVKEWLEMKYALYSEIFGKTSKNIRIHRIMNPWMSLKLSSHGAILQQYIHERISAQSQFRKVCSGVQFRFFSTIYMTLERKLNFPLNAPSPADGFRVTACQSQSIFSLHRVFCYFSRFLDHDGLSALREYFSRHLRTRRQYQ